MSTAILPAPQCALQTRAGCNDSLHAKKSPFRWLAPSKKGNDDASTAKGARNPPGARECEDLPPRPPGRPALQRTTSLRESRSSESPEPRLPLAELKSILKRTRCLSDGGSVDAGYTPEMEDFWAAFRSVEELYDEGGRKRVSFSEKIVLNSFRPGTSILQQKQKAQKKREKRQNKERRRTASESDATEMAQITNNMSDLSLSRHNDSDSGLETEGSPTLEAGTWALMDVEEEIEPSPADTTSSKAKKKRNRKHRKS